MNSIETVDVLDVWNCLSVDEHFDNYLKKKKNQQNYEQVDLNSFEISSIVLNEEKRSINRESNMDRLEPVVEVSYFNIIQETKVLQTISI